MVTLKEFMKDYEIERKFDTINLIIDGRLIAINYKPLIGTSLFDDRLDYFVVNWTHGDTHCIISIESDYYTWLSVKELRKALSKN